MSVAIIKHRIKFVDGVLEGIELDQDIPCVETEAKDKLQAMKNLIDMKKVIHPFMGTSSYIIISAEIEQK